MTHFSHIPLVRILLPLLLGVILFLIAGYFFHVFEILAVTAVFIMAGLIIRRFFLPHFSVRSAFGIHVMLFLVFAGYTLAQSRYELKRSAHFSRHAGEKSILRIVLTEPPAEKENSMQVDAVVTHVFNDTTGIETSGKVLLWFEKEEHARKLEYGDVLFIQNKIQPVQRPMNPNAFNFKNYLAWQNIFHQAYISSDEWFPADHNEGNLLLAKAYQMRREGLRVLEQNNITGRDFAVASALLLGYKEYLDEDLQREFSGAGAMHILCVSGLHVGIIFLALNFMLGFLNRIRYGPIIKTLIIILLIWFYAAITGFSPSVKRASTMFTFLALGLSLNRQTNIYNTLAGSAIFLMLTDPLIITRLGFQLSYAAVFSIVWLQPHLSTFAKFENKLTRFCWEIATVSVAAQLGTLPITIYYFNQFPNYFILTNLIVIPLTGIIIKSGIVFFMLSFLPLVPYYAGWLLSKIIRIMHTSVAFIEALPGSTFNNLVISSYEIFIVFSTITSLGLFISYRKKMYAGFFFFLSFIMAVSATSRQLVNKQTRQLVVYHFSYCTAVDVFKDQRCFMYASDEVFSHPRHIKFNMASHRLKKGVSAHPPVILNWVEQPYQEKVFFKGGFMNIDGLTVRIISSHQQLLPEQPFEEVIDHIILSKNARVRISNLVDAFQPRQIVIDCSNSLYRAQQWMQECDSLGVKCWSVLHKGAYVKQF
jgi:competence protein ComEC